MGTFTKTFYVNKYLRDGVNTDLSKLDSGLFISSSSSSDSHTLCFDFSDLPDDAEIIFGTCHFKLHGSSNSSSNIIYLGTKINDGTGTHWAQPITPISTTSLIYNKNIRYDLLKTRLKPPTGQSQGSFIKEDNGRLRFGLSSYSSSITVFFDELPYITLVFTSDTYVGEPEEIPNVNGHPLHFADFIPISSTADSSTGDNLSGTTYSNCTGKGVEAPDVTPSLRELSTHTSISNGYGYMKYKFDFSSIPDDAIIEICTVQAKGQKQFSGTTSYTNVCGVRFHTGSIYYSGSSAFTYFQTTTENWTLELPIVQIPTVEQLKHTNTRVTGQFGYFGGAIAGITITIAYYLESETIPEETPPGDSDEEENEDFEYSTDETLVHLHKSTLIDLGNAIRYVSPKITQTTTQTVTKTENFVPVSYTKSGLRTSDSYIVAVGKGVDAAAVTTNICSSTNDGTTGYVNFIFDTSSIPKEAIIKSVKCQIQGHIQNISATYKRARCQLRMNGSTIGSAVNFTSTSSEILTIELTETETITYVDLSSLVLRFVVQYYGGNVHGATLSIEYEVEEETKTEVDDDRLMLPREMADRILELTFNSNNENNEENNFSYGTFTIDSNNTYFDSYRKGSTLLSLDEIGFTPDIFICYCKDTHIEGKTSAFLAYLDNTGKGINISLYENCSGTPDVSTNTGGLVNYTNDYNSIFHPLIDEKTYTVYPLQVVLKNNFLIFSTDVNSTQYSYSSMHFGEYDWIAYKFSN